MLNKTTIQGRFTRKPEITEVGQFKKCDFTIAWSEKYKETEKKCFMKCTAWNSQAEHICKYFDKGSECIVEGRNVTDTWEKDGQTQSKTFVELEKIHFCGSKNSSGAATTKDAGFIDIPAGTEEEIPFN